VSWAAATGAVSYELERSADAGGTWEQVYSAANTTYAEAVTDGSYRYRVRALNASGSSDWRTGATDCVVLIPPAVPASITYPAVSSTGLRAR